MNHNKQIFTFTNKNEEGVKLLTKKYSFALDELIVNSYKELTLIEFAELIIPQLFEDIKVFSGIQWDENNLNEALKVLQYFEAIRHQCIELTEKIKNRNKCFGYKDPANDFKFDPSEFVSPEEFEGFVIQQFCNNDPAALMTVMHNYCPCEFTAFQAGVLTDQIKENKKTNHEIEKIKAQQGNNART